MTKPEAGDTHPVVIADESKLPRDESDWERFKDDIVNLYIERNETCPAVIDIMRKQYGFDAR